MTNTEQRIKDIDKEMIKVGIIDALGSIMVGLGLYGKFAANGNAFLPILNDESVVNFLLGVGAAVMAWGAYRFITLSRDKIKIRNGHSL
jgi:hypothetical protein